MKRKGKGMSFDQKRQKMLSIFHHTKSVFNYQEIEKLSIKAGIPFPVVKDILKSLQGDSLVECEKIGIGVFYWSFPSKTYQIMATRIEQTEKQIQDSSVQISSLNKEIEDALPGRQDTEQRRELLDEISRIKRQQKGILTEIEKYIRFDPQRVDLLQKQNQQLKDQINQWTDNLQQIKKFLKKNNIMNSDSEIEAQFDIPADMDYIE